MGYRKQRRLINGSLHLLNWDLFNKKEGKFWLKIFGIILLLLVAIPLLILLIRAIIPSHILPYWLFVAALVAEIILLILAVWSGIEVVPDFIRAFIIFEETSEDPRRFWEFDYLGLRQERRDKKAGIVPPEDGTQWK